MYRASPSPHLALLLASPLWLLGSAAAQKRALKPEDRVLRVEPTKLVLQAGEGAKLKTEVVDVGGRPVDKKLFDLVFFSNNRRSLRVRGSGDVLARRPGKYRIVVRVALPGEQGPQFVVPVEVVRPKPLRIEFVKAPKQIFAGTSTPMAAGVVNSAGRRDDKVDLDFSVDTPAVASVDAFGVVTAKAPGRCKITAKNADFDASHSFEVLANPVRSLALEASAIRVRTGDVVRLRARLADADGQAVDGVPVHYSFEARPDDRLGQVASGQIEQDGRFVAETPGLYTLLASCGDARDRLTVRARPRKVRRRIEFVGHGPVLDVHTSDLWVWEGQDGRDYCVTGTWGANGDAIFWDVTDPSKIKRIATVQVDARTINDVKVSKDGKICVLSREGASNRKNGIVILDVRKPSAPRILSTFTENLTGGVHNVFIAKNYVYALSAARRYDVIDIQDPSAPVRVSSYQIFKPGASIHDAWVENGLAYSSNWRYGVHIVDVGNGIKGGTPQKPVKVGSYAYPSGWNHAAFPFRSKSAGKFYVIAGDETFPYGLNVKDKPTRPRGWFHFIDFTDMDKPREVARYQVPEAGTHNLWVEGEVMYGAYYNGGLRVVDISGELMGDLYRQGREIGFYLPTHKKSVVPNAPMVWGPQPHKGHIFFSDWNSGLWAVKLGAEDKRPR